MKLYIIITVFFLRFCFPNPPALCLSFIHLTLSHSVFEYLNHRNRFGFACLFTLKIQFSFVVNTSVTDRPTYRASICLHTVHSPATHHQKKKEGKKKRGGGGGGGGEEKEETVAGCQRVENILTLKSERVPLCRLSTVANDLVSMGSSNTKVSYIIYLYT